MKLVKCAQSIARDVMKFWGKARAVYNFMVQEKVNEIKRAKMDKELETFVQQSERCARLGTLCLTIRDLLGLFSGHQIEQSRTGAHHPHPCTHQLQSTRMRRCRKEARFMTTERTGAAQ